MESKVRILIIDDDNGIRTTLRLILQRVGYDTDEARMGKEALAKVQEKFINLALLDIKLPDIDGVDLIADLKRINPDLVVVMVTGYASLFSAIQALTAGATAYISKPLNMDEVLAVIKQGLEKQRLTIEKRRAEHALHESKEQYRLLFENMPIGIYRTNPDGRITMANPALIRMLGYDSFEDLASINLEQDGHPIGFDRQGFRELVEEEGEIKGLERAWRRKDGQTTYLRENARVFRGDDGVIQFYEGTLEDVSERKKVEQQREELLEQVSAGRERLKYLASRIVSVQEDERQSISRELHDEAGQTLTYLTIELDAIRAKIPESLQDTHHDLDEASSLVQTIIDQIHSLAEGLRPPALDTLGLNPTLEGFCREFSRRTQIHTEYSGAEIPALPQMADITLYRFLQEALNNVAKHANASRVSVVLFCDDKLVSLTVSDNGKGIEHEGGFIDPQWLLKNRCLGLLGLRERFGLLGGQFQIESRPGSGTQLVGMLPLNGKYIERRSSVEDRDTGA
jgi:two-component system sensor histidine kinase UhpB